MSFASVVVQDGIGEVYKLDISLDGFSTVYARYASHGGVDATNDYDPRIRGVSDFTRGLGEDFALRATAVQVQLDNVDGVADWLGADNSANVFLARARLYLGVYARAASGVLDPTTIQWKQLGEFVVKDPPVIDDQSVTLNLDTDVNGALLDTPALPTLANWYGDGTDTSCPLKYVPDWHGLAPPTASPMQLAWGDDWVQCQRAAVGLTSASSPFGAAAIFVICATADTVNGNLANDVQEVRVHLKGGPGTQSSYNSSTGEGGLQVPSTQVQLIGGGSDNPWVRYRSSTITDAMGRSWRVIWLAVQKLAFESWLKSLPPNEYQGVTDPKDPANVATTAGDWTQMISELWVRGYPLSAMANQSSAVQSPCDIAQDLATNYYGSRAVSVDSASFSRYRSNYPLSSAAGVIGGQSARARTLKQHISDIAGSCDVDLFIGWDGTLRASARNYDYAAITGTVLEIGEERISKFSKQIPARELRWAPFNRIRYSDAKPFPLQHPSLRGTPAVPDREFSATQISWGRVLVREKSLRWVPSFYAPSSAPTISRSADLTIRNMVTFTTDFEALQLEIGDLFKLNWTANNGGRYVSTLFRLEEVRAVPFTNECVVKAIWADDVVTVRPFLLDDETYLQRSVGGSTRTATVTDSSGTVTFSSGSLVSDGVVAGDHLILKDTAETAAGFKRNRALKISSVTDATHLVVTDASLDFGAPAGIAVQGWEIRRSHLTYPTVITDATHYPDGANMYGRTSGTAAPPAYSGAGTGGFTDAHRLRDG